MSKFGCYARRGKSLFNRYVLFGGMLAAAVFAIDLIAPPKLGLAVIPHFIAIVLTVPGRSSKGVWAVTAMTVAFAALGYAGKAPTIEFDLFALNRITICGLLIAMGLLCARFVTYREGWLRARVEESARREAERLNRAKTNFLAHMSHELRTPLNAIIGFAQFMKMDAEALGPEKRREYAEIIEVSATHLLEIINDILDISKVESGTVSLSESEMPLDLIAGDALRLLTEAARAKNVSLTLDKPDEAVVVWADGRLMREILINLLENALKFTDAGGHVLIAVRAESDGGASISVSDTGIGIADDDLQTVLEPFVQVRADVMHTHKGVGLGLALCRKLATLQGAKFEIDSTVGVGTQVRVVFPPERRRRA